MSLNDADRGLGGSAGGAEPGTVVLVDDNPAVLALLACVLGSDGIRVAAYGNGAGAVSRVREGGVEVVVSDISMPGMSGLEILRAIRACDPDLPVVLLTGHPSVDSASEAIEFGVFRYLTKPFEADVVRGTVQHAAQLYRLARVKREALEIAGAAGASDRAGLAVAFERALERLSVVFQPVVSLSGRAVFAHEVLMRSAEPTLPRPGDVIDAAERLGRVFDLGRIVRGWAAMLFQRVPRETLLFLNLHPQELLDPELLDSRSPLAALSDRVVLEITERAALEKIHDIRARVSLLRSRGYRVAIDDLGAGYAGLTSFAVLEPDIVKLDMSLTRGVHASPVKQKVIASMTTLCREMGMAIVAEGVETLAESNALLDLGCDLQQGYFFALPGPPFPEVRWSSDTIPSSPPDSIAPPSGTIAGSERDSMFASTKLPPNVLVVDDEEPARALVTRVLTEKGMSVAAVSSGNDALTILAGGAPFNAIVTDLQMPGLHGVEFLRAIRERDLDVPVIVLTGHASVESAIAVVEYGAFRYLQKPLKNRELAALVKEATAMHRLATLKRHALELRPAKTRLIGDEAGLDAHFDRALDQLWIAFQPVVAWSDQSVYGYEALVRSNEPLLATPEDLFDAAERLGRVHDLGRAIRREVAARVVAAPDDATIFVNLHVSDFEDESLYAADEPLSSEADRVVLEVTERAPLHRARDLRERVGQLRGLGYRLAIDDLGAGYAGLASLSLLEPDVVKLDVSLVRGVDGSARRASIVRSMIAVCRDELGTRVVCEGVETSAERDALDTLGADLLQGFFFAPPEPTFRRPSVLLGVPWLDA